MSKESHLSLSDNFFIGEEKLLKFLIVDAADAALDVSSYTFKWVLGQEGTIIKTIDSGITTEDGNGTNDRVVVPIDRDDTVNLPEGVYRHTLWRTDADSEQVLTYGDVYLRKHPDA